MPGKGYWIYTLWLASVVIVGIGGFFVGGAETPPKFLASIEEALSSMFGNNSEDFVEVLDVSDYPQETKRENIRIIDAVEEGEVILIDQPTTQAKECNPDSDIDPKIGAVIINEVAWMGGLESQDLSYSDEWIELRNISSSSVDISGWQIKDIKGDVDMVL